MVVVAPFTGAWIETLGASDGVCSKLQSHPSRVRGLKQVLRRSLNMRERLVAPFTGAWIETNQPLRESDIV